MFRVTICSVSTGRVRVVLFASRHEAERYVEAREEAWEGRKNVRTSFRRAHRVEVSYHPLPTPAAGAAPPPAQPEPPPDVALVALQASACLLL
jgi:hypothetical protein